ncbi:MAG TPA: hypothetical protein VK469_24205 [Candidatus Kapabacteria bacterium]|nr:hypothetical protein [Candidatus Kapabacteria bacterium]
MRLSTEKLKEDLVDVLKIAAQCSRNKLDNLVPHDAIVGDPESIAYIDGSKEWHWEDTRR